MEIDKNKIKEGTILKKEYYISYNDVNGDRRTTRNFTLESRAKEFADNLTAQGYDSVKVNTMEFYYFYEIK